MLRPTLKRMTALLSGVVLNLSFACSAHAVALPDAAVDTPATSSNAPQTAVFAGGCFWGIQAVFQHVKGVKKATSGYVGGAAATATYSMVSTGTTGHAESVQVIYDPSQISYGKLLKIFFSVAHDPTELNRQGPDHGTQYRSAIFTTSDEQQRIARSYIDQLKKVKAFRDPVVTQVEPLKAFYAAEDYHQDYATNHPRDPYIFINDLPKVANLQKQFPDVYSR